MHILLDECFLKMFYNMMMEIVPLSFDDKPQCTLCPGSCGCVPGAALTSWSLCLAVGGSASQSMVGLWLVGALCGQGVGLQACSSLLI